MTQTLLTLGHGYSADALAKRLLPQDWTVLGTTRSADKADAMRSMGITPVAWDEQSVSDALAQATHLLISSGPDADGDPSLLLAGDAIRHRASHLAWAGYLSTTGVYGDQGGDWVDENTPLEPSTNRGRMRVKAEAAWSEIDGLPLHIFRLAGIYGPGRGPFSKVRAGTARRIIKDGQVFSRIHVDDIAQVLEASIKAPAPGTAYNVCDDDPAPPQDVIAYAAELLGVPVPPAIAFEDAEMTPMARSFYAESKRVSNHRIKQALGVALLYPNYREGLRALLEQEARTAG